MMLLEMIQVGKTSLRSHSLPFVSNRYWEREKVTLVFSLLYFEVFMWYGMTFVHVCVFGDSLLKRYVNCIHSL